MGLFESIQPRKQRKARYSAPMHARRKFVHVHVSKELRAKLGITRRSLLIHKGDKVRLRRGDDAGKTGNVMEVDYSDAVIYVEGIVSKTAKGTEKMRPVQPASLEIMDGDFAKKDRADLIARLKKKGAAKPAAAQKQ